MPRIRPLLRPKWLLFHVLVALLVVLMVNLGLWQLRRLDQRKDFNAEVRARSALEVEPYATVMAPGVDPSAVQWRIVTVTGTYVPNEQVVQINRAQNGRPGTNLLTPLQLDDGRLLLVNRGFVADGERPPAPPGGPVTISGRVRTSQSRRFGEIADSTDGDLAEVRLIDIARLAPQMPAPLEAVYVERISSEPAEGSTLAPLPSPELDNGPHLSYAVQWSIFSICAIVGWVLVVRRALGSARNGDGKVRSVAVADEAPAVRPDQEQLGDGGVERPQVERSGGRGLEGQA